MIGVAGNRRRRPGQPSWSFVDTNFNWEEPGYVSGCVAHGPQPFGKVAAWGPVPAECELMDGVFLAAKSDTLVAGRPLRSGVRLSPLRHRLLPSRPRARAANLYLAHLHHPSRQRKLRHARLVRHVRAVHREVGRLGSTWAILEGQITIVIEATSHENNRRGRCQLRVGQDKSRDFFRRPLAQATPPKPTAALEIPRENRPRRA